MLNGVGAKLMGTNQNTDDIWLASRYQQCLHEDKKYHVDTSSHVVFLKLNFKASCRPMYRQRDTENKTRVFKGPNVSPARQTYERQVILCSTSLGS